MWLHSNRGNVVGMPVANDDIRGVLDWIFGDTRRFSKLLLRARAATVSHMSFVALAESWHNDLLDQCNLYSFPASQGILLLLLLLSFIGNKVLSVGAVLSLICSMPLLFIRPTSMVSVDLNMLT